MRVLLITLVVGLVTMARAWACEYPDQSVEMPDGTMASKNEMVSAQAEVKAYVAAMEAFLACLDEGIKDVDAIDDQELAARKRRVNEQRYNAAVDALEIVAEQFNAEVRAFKSANAAP